MEPQSHWKGGGLPEPGWLAGYSCLMERYDLDLPAPPRLAMVAERHQPEDHPDWLVLPRRRRPDDTLTAQLEFALKYEGVDLAVLNALFRVLEPEVVAAIVREKPTGAYSRRIWFLYEWVTQSALDLPDAGPVRAAPAVDPEQQVALKEGEMSTRHRVLNNLPGTPAFCPMVRWTDRLRELSRLDLKATAALILERVHPDLLRRAAAFLLLKDSRTSFQIEGERPSLSRAQRWASAIEGAGLAPLTMEEVVRLQRVVIGDSRLVRLGLREEGGFVGVHDRVTHEPIPDHINARPEDLPDLISGLVEYERRSTADDVDPVVAAAVVAFGFVYMHPFEDGNGRVHRWLMHHLLALGGFNSSGGVIFPISSSILNNIVQYRSVLESYSRPLLDHIEWEPTDKGNVRVLNETADFYRFFDATAHAEFLYERVQDTVIRELPEEVAYLQSYDRFVEGIEAMIDMPTRAVELLHRFLRQNDGRLSRRAREKEFSGLTVAEVAQIEELYADSIQ